MDRRPTLRIVSLALAALAAAPACASPADRGAAPRAPAARTASPAEAIRAAVAAAGLRTISISVRDVATGATVADLDAAKPLAPASNMKVLTTAAALRVLGPDYAFKTRLVRSGERLVVVGDGDPSLGDPAILDEMVHVDASGSRRQGLTTEDLVDVWAKAAKQAGIANVRELVVDDRIFDREFTHPAWPADQLANSYCAEIAGLNFHVGLAQARLRADGGRVAVAEWTPAAPWIEVDASNAKVGGKAAKGSLWIGRGTTPWQFTLNGSAKSVPGEPIAVCVHDMPAFFGRYLQERMKASGVAVQSVRVAAPGDPAADGAPVGPPITSPIARVVQQCNTESQNLYAESLLKRIGAARTGTPGSWANGTAALRGEVDAVLGAGASNALVAADGSGLCRDNRVPAALVTSWLRGIAMDQRVGPVFIRSLAVAGVNGTVRKRFDGLDTQRVFVPCKTGYINGVSCLSGYVGRPGETPRFTFSVLCNDLSKEKDGVHKAKALQEQIVRILGDAL